MIKKMYKPRVSIVIPAYNASNYLAEAIDSALAQSYENIEIIVVNDGSKDDGATAAVAERYGNKIKYFEKENGGSSSALNMGISNMTGEWFSWLSHDDLYTPEKVKTQIEYINSLGLSCEEISGHVFFSAWDIIDAHGKTIRRMDEKTSKKISESINSFPGNEYLIAEPTGYIFHGCSCFIHKSVFEKVGVFDENLRLINDLDLWFRIYSTGYKIHFLPEALVKGRIHQKQVSKSIGYSYHNPEQDMYWTRSLDWLIKNHPDNYDLFHLFGRNAYLKTRNVEAVKAFNHALLLKPESKMSLALEKTQLKVYALAREFAKKLYQIFIK